MHKTQGKNERSIYTNDLTEPRPLGSGAVDLEINPDVIQLLRFLTVAARITTLQILYSLSFARPLPSPVVLQKSPFFLCLQ